jgi:hypothetical protein
VGFFLNLDLVWTVMTSRFRLPAGRTYNVRASELARDRQRTEAVCNIFLLDNTVQAVKVNVSILFPPPPSLPSPLFLLLLITSGC